MVTNGYRNNSRSDQELISYCSAIARKENADVEKERGSPDGRARFGQVGHVHHDVGDAQENEEQCHDVQPRLPGLQQVRDDDSRKEKRQRLKGIGLGRIGAAAPIALPRQPATRVVICLLYTSPSPRD